MKYHLCKQTRVYDGTPYIGPTSNGQMAEANTLGEAIHMAQKYQERNPVGWNVFDSTTGKCVYGKEIIYGWKASTK